MIFFIIEDKATHVEMEDDGKIFTNIEGWGIKDELPQYEYAVDHLKFIHNCVIPIYGEKI